MGGGNAYGKRRKGEPEGEKARQCAGKGKPPPITEERPNDSTDTYFARADFLTTSNVGKKRL